MSINWFSPTSPKTFGISKTHKHEISLRLTISGIGTDPQNIAKSLAKWFTPILGTMNNSQVKNSGDYSTQ